MRRELEGPKESNIANCNADFCAILKLCDVKIKKGFLLKNDTFLHIRPSKLNGSSIQPKNLFPEVGDFKLLNTLNLNVDSCALLELYFI